jgi:hypothetical protein
MQLRLPAPAGTLGPEERAPQLEGTMIFGFAPFTFFHILISLVGIWSGFVVLRGMLASEFGRVPALAELAPTQSEPPFAVIQGVVLVLFVWLGVAAAKRFRAVPAGGA